MTILDFIRDRARYYNCPVCGRSLKGCQVRMLKQIEDRYTVQVTCASCGVQFVVILAIQGDSIEADEEVATVEAAPLEELEEVEVEPAPEPIQVDEVLDVHLLLRDFEGSFSDLLHEPSEHRS
jgi:transcription elongation factor Elf1